MGQCHQMLDQRRSPAQEALKVEGDLEREHRAAGGREPLVTTPPQPRHLTTRHHREPVHQGPALGQEGAS